MAQRSPDGSPVEVCIDMIEWNTGLLKHYGIEAESSSLALSVPSRPQIAFAGCVSERISTATPTLIGRSKPFSYSILFSKSFYQATNGGDTLIKYEYEYQNSQDSLEDVEDALKGEWTPDFSRNIHIANATTLSEASVSIHLRELERRGKAIKVGKKWIHRATIPELEVWQLKRTLDQLDGKQDVAKKLEQRYQEKLEMKKEYLREMKDQMREQEFKQEQQEIIEMEEKRNYYREKQNRLRESKRRVFGMIKELQTSNSKESGNSDGLLKSEPNKITA